MSRDVKFIEHQCPYREALGDAIEVDEGTRCVMDDGGKEELVPPPAVDPMVAEGGAAAARAAGGEETVQQPPDGAVKDHVQSPAGDNVAGAGVVPELAEGVLARGLPEEHGAQELVMESGRGKRVKLPDNRLKDYVTHTVSEKEIDS